MHHLDYIAIAIFTLIVFAVGISFSFFKSNVKTYFAAGGKVPWAVNGLSLFMSFFSAGTFVVWGSIAFEHGLVSLSIQFTMCLAGFVVAYLVAPKWRKTKVLTAGEFIHQRLGQYNHKIYTYLILTLSLFYTGAFLYPVAKIVSVSIDVDIETCILVLGMLTIIYTVFGGLWSVIITDTLQFVILFAIVFIVVILSLEAVGGISNFINKTSDSFWNLTTNEYTIGFLIAYFFYNIIFIGGNWAYVQRYTSVKSENDAKKVGLTFAWLYLVSPILWMLPPMVYRLMTPSIEGSTEGAYILVCKQVLPVGLLGLMVGGMIFATASSVNTTLNLAGAIITNDIYKQFFPNAGDRNIMKVAKVATFLFGMGTLIIALLIPYFGGIVNAILSIGAVSGCSIYGPPIWALFSNRIPGKHVIYIMIVSLTINSYFLIFYELSRENEMILGTALPFLLLTFFEVFNRFSLSKYRITSIDTVKNNDENNKIDTNIQNRFGLKVLSIALFLVGAMVILLGTFNYEHVRLVVTVGFIIIVMGILIMRYKDKIYDKK